MWLWISTQIDKHFADCCLMLLIVLLLGTIITYAVFARLMGWAQQPENMGWAREMVSAIVGCLLGRLAKIDARSNGNGNGHPVK